MIDAIYGFYGPSFAKTVVYMLQSDEYNVGDYIKWFWRTRDFSHVSRRRVLDKTIIAKLLVVFMLCGMLGQIIVGLAILSHGQQILGFVLLLTYPLVWAHLVILPTLVGRFTIIQHRNKKLAHQATKNFAEHKATIIAVAGSYGKTSMKELLLTVIGEGKKVAATPANKNVITEHAKFARNLSGDEDVLIIEYGEERPGDILKFAKISQPTIGVITGLAPAHLDKYKSLAAAGKDIFSLAEYLQGKNVYVNGDSLAVKNYLKPEFHIYSQQGIGKYHVDKVKVDISGTSFELKLGESTYKLHTHLLGVHQIGPLAAAVAIADELGLTRDQIEAGVAKTKPYEHRMEPRQIAGAWVIDDTYNGNIEGMKAGLELLKGLKANRKIYVTPGLVAQGQEADRIHVQLGQYIAEANPDQVVLMRNSATDAIQRGLSQGGYQGELTIQPDPLEYYSNMDKVLAAGDLVLMQNDWTDNYN